MVCDVVYGDTLGGIGMVCDVVYGGTLGALAWCVM